MKVYAKLSEQDEILELVSPDWRDSAGNPIIDEMIFIAERIVPVDYDAKKPDIDSFYQSSIPKPMNLWTVKKGDVTIKVWDSVTNDFKIVTKTDWPYRVEVEYEVKELSLEEKKEDLLRNTVHLINDRILDGFVYAPLQIKLDVDTPSVLNLMLLREWALANSVQEVTLRTYDNSFVRVSTEELDSIIKAIAQWKIELYQEKWNLESTLRSAGNIDELKTVSVGVPETVPVDLMGRGRWRL